MILLVFFCVFRLLVMRRSASLYTITIQYLQSSLVISVISVPDKTLYQSVRVEAILAKFHAAIYILLYSKCY